MSTLPGDLVIDPFGGSGTTYAICEANSRNLISVEIQNCDLIIERLSEGNLHYHQNNDYVEG